MNGAWTVDATCAGPKGCTAKFPFVDCDDSVASAGDPCSKDGHATCTLDGRGILECQNGRFALMESCARGTCRHAGLVVRCQ